MINILYSHMNYAEFNGLGLLGQTIKCINEKKEDISVSSYEEFVEKRVHFANELKQFIEKQEKLTDIQSNSMDKFMEFYINNLNDTHYDAIKTLEQRLTTLDKATTILNNEYNNHHTKFMAAIDKPDEYSKIMGDFLYIKTMNEFIDRTSTQFQNLPKIMEGSILSKE